MKKVLSLVLAFAMILGSFGFVFASQFPDVADTEYYSEAVNVLSGFGVIGGFPDGTFKPEDQVTRAQMATMVVNALGMTVSGKSDTKFSDVPASHWASGFIAYATSVGFVAGYPDGTFKPEDPVTYDQALTMIVAALGYQSEALPGSWPGNFVNKAQGLGILDTCKTTGTANAPRQDIACFLYDTLDQAIGYTDKDGAWHANIGPKNPITGLFEDDTMYVRLGAEPYDGGNGAGQPFVVDGDEEATIDMTPYFGAYVTAYATKDDDTTIVAIKDVLSEFVEGKINSAKTTLTAEDATYKLAGTGAEQHARYKYFNNGDAVTPVVAFDATPNKTMIFAVKTSGTKITDVYSCQEWTAAGTFRAKADVQTELEEDKSLDGITYTFALDDDKNIDESTFMMAGKTSLADLAKDDVITIYNHTSGTNAGKISKIEVSTEIIEGSITRVSKANDVYTIAGTDYDVATGAYLVAGTTVGTLAPKAEGKFFLNYAGEIADFEETVATTKNYGVVLMTGQESGRYAGDTTGYIKLYIADDSVAEYGAKSSIKVNGNTAGATAIAYTGASYTNQWNLDDGSTTFDLADGSVVEYELDADNVLVGLTVLADVDDIPTVPATELAFTGMIYNGTKATDSTVVFSYTASGTSPKQNPDNYSVVEASQLKDAKVTHILGGIDSGSYTALLVEGLGTAKKSLAIIVDDSAGKGTDGFIYSALYEGAINVNLVAVPNLSAGVYTTGAAATVYTFVFDGDVVKTANVLTEGAANDYIESRFAPTAKLKAAEATYFMDAADVNYPLDSEVAIYIYDAADDKWTKPAKLATNVVYQYITMIDSDKDGDWDIVIATK